MTMASRDTKIALTIILCLLYIAYSVSSSRLFLKQVADNYKNGHVITASVDVNHSHNDTNDASMMGAVKEQFDAKEDKEKEEEEKDDKDLLLIEEYRTKRGEQFYSWFEGNGTDKLFPNVDANGTILDFVIAGKSSGFALFIVCVHYLCSCMCPCMSPCMSQSYSCNETLGVTHFLLLITYCYHC
jgi:hypothetical protein